MTLASMGATQLPLTTIGLAIVLNVRARMEDNVLMRRGEPVQNNAPLVERTARIPNQLDRRSATPAETRRAVRALRPRRGRLPAGAEPVVAQRSG